MKAVIQRVSQAEVKVDANIVGKISGGLLLLIGIEEEDEKSDADWLVQKILNLRIFGDVWRCTNWCLNRKLLRG